MRLRLLDIWDLVRESALAFVNDSALTHGAAMAFYAATSLAPILLIVVAIAGIAVGHEAAQVAVAAQLGGLMGPQSADLLQATLESASNLNSGTWAAIVGSVALLVTASGVFGEMQSALNAIWKTMPKGNSVSRLVRARAVSLGLVAALGFLLLVSLLASAAISAMSGMINAKLPFGTIILSTINGVVSFALITVMFAAIYKVLPDRSLAWRDVIMGSVLTAALFTVGKSIIGWYIGTSTIASSYGAAGGLLVLLLWVYYSSQIFLFGAELTRAYSIRYGSRKDLAGLVRNDARVASRSIPPPVAGEHSKDMLLITLMAAAWTAGAVAARLLRHRHFSG